MAFWQMIYCLIIINFFIIAAARKWKNNSKSPLIAIDLRDFSLLSLVLLINNAFIGILNAVRWRHTSERERNKNCSLIAFQVVCTAACHIESCGFRSAAQKTRGDYISIYSVELSGGETWLNPSLDSLLPLSRCYKNVVSD